MLRFRIARSTFQETAPGGTTPGPFSMSSRASAVVSLAAGGLENGRPGTHILGMAKSSRPRLFEVRVIPLKPDQWEWRVCEGDKAIMTGYESSRETAQIEGDSALFMLLSEGGK